MKFILFLGVPIILLICCCQVANCEEPSIFRQLFGIWWCCSSKTSPINKSTEPSLTHDQDPIFTSNCNTTSSNENCKALPPVVPLNPRKVTANSVSVTDEELLQISENLYKRENSLLDQIIVNVQGKTRSIDTNDVAPERLLQINEQTLWSPTIAKMRELYDNYEMDTSVEEIVTPIELKEEDDFLDAVLATCVMRQAMLFLQNKGIVSSKPKSQRDLLKTIWFTIYSRGQGKLGSSGFEHVFLNEIKNGKIIGLHNWVYFDKEEKAGHLDYKGYVNKLDLGNKGKIIAFRFTYNGITKTYNSMFVGTSPELELALYTICFELRPDQKCPVSLGGNKFNIQTNVWRHNGKILIGSAYPSIQCEHNNCNLLSTYL